jgi:hypothetical protein
MKALLTFCLVGLFVVTACRKKSDPPPSSEDQPAPAAAEPGKPLSLIPDNAAPPPPTVPSVENAAAPPDVPEGTSREQPMDVESLNTVIGDYIASKDRIPKDFAEMVRLKLLPRAPTPPPGYTYEIDQIRGKVVVKKK